MALWDEYRRDLIAGSAIARPRGYFRMTTPAWGRMLDGATASARFFANWLNSVARDAGSAPMSLACEIRLAALPGLETGGRRHVPAC